MSVNLTVACVLLQLPGQAWPEHKHACLSALDSLQTAQARTTQSVCALAIDSKASTLCCNKPQTNWHCVLRLLIDPSHKLLSRQDAADRFPRRAPTQHHLAPLSLMQCRLW